MFIYKIYVHIGLKSMGRISHNIILRWCPCYGCPNFILFSRILRFDKSIYSICNVYAQIKVQPLQLTSTDIVPFSFLTLPQDATSTSDLTIPILMFGALTASQILNVQKAPAWKPKYGSLVWQRVFTVQTHSFHCSRIQIFKTETEPRFPQHFPVTVEFAFEANVARWLLSILKTSANDVDLAANLIENEKVIPLYNV